MEQASDSGALLGEWFGRLRASGVSADVVLTGPAEDLVRTVTAPAPVSGTFTGLHGRDGCDYWMRSCWSMRVQDRFVREVIGDYDQNKVTGRVVSAR